MSSVEIEDVLSSIRRLVSEDLNPAPRPQIVSKMVVEDKLILTPALRVVRSDAKPMPTVPLVPQPRLHLGPAHMVVPVTPDVVTALGQAVGLQSLDWESETGDPGPEADSLDWSSFTFPRRHLPEGRVAFVPQAEAAPLAEPVSAEPVADAPAVQSAPVDAVWADAAEAEVVAHLRQQTDHDQADPVTNDAPAAEVMPGVEQVEDNIFSEQVLRELVRDLIRAELQGDLGERITRNIRKLVRAEIARAIAVQALE